MLETLTLNNFRGMNRLSDRLNMNKEFAWNIANGYIKKDVKSGLGIIKQRSGTTKFNTVAFSNECKTLFEPKWSAGSTDVFIREGTRWAKYDGVDTFANLDTGRSDGVRGMGVMFGNQAILVDGGIPRKVTAAYAVSNVSADANMPQDATAVHVHQHKVWMNSAANPMQAKCCKSDDATSATAWTGSSDAATLDFSRILPAGDTLIGFATYSNAFLIFIFTKYVVVYNCGTDPALFTLQQIIPINCLSGHAVTLVGNDLSIGTLQGLSSFKTALVNQDLDLNDLSKYIQPLYASLVSALADKTVVSTAFSHNLNHLYFCIPGVTHTILVYSVDIQNFVGVWTGYDCYSILERKDGTMLVGGDGYVYTMNSGLTDDSATINFSYDFPALYGSNPDANKAFRQIEGLVRHEGSPLVGIGYSYSEDVGQSLSTAVQKQFTSSGVDWDSTEAEWDVAAWAGADIDRFLTSDLLSRGKAFSMSISNYTNGASVEIPYLIARYKKEGIKT